MFEILAASFGGLISILLALLAWIANHMVREVRELREVVGDHGRQLSSINTTLRHLDRRSDFPPGT